MRALLQSQIHWLQHLAVNSFYWVFNTGHAAMIYTLPPIILIKSEDSFDKYALCLVFHPDSCNAMGVWQSKSLLILTVLRYCDNIRRFFFN